MEELHRRIRDALWPERPPDSAVADAALAAGRYAYALLRDFLAGELSLRAMSLVYTTILSIVPLLAFSFAVIKGLGLHREMEPLLLTFLAPVGPRAPEIADMVIGFVDNVSGSVLASLGLILLLITALSMAQKVESSFNFVWRVDRPRSIARRLTEYLSVMFLGPIIMTIALGLLAAVSSTRVMTRLRELEPIGAWIAWLGDVLPYGLLVAAFTALYLYVPNARVHFKPAFAGGIFAGIAWALGGKAFTSIVAGASRTEAIYSGFAIVLITMIWLYVSWLILLLGAQLAFYAQHPDYLRLGQRAEIMGNGLRERLALGAMLLVGRDFDAPGHGWRTEGLAARLRVPRHHLERITASLTNAGLLTETAEQRLMPARDPRRIRAIDVLRAVRHPATDEWSREPREWNATVNSLADRIDAAIEAALGEKSLADLVDELDGVDGAGIDGAGHA